jgi:hypothetical protein
MAEFKPDVEAQHEWNAKWHAAAQRAVWRHSPYGRWLRRIAHFIVAGVGVLLAFLWLGSEEPVERRLLAATPWVLIAALWVVLLRGGFPWLSRLSARQSMIDPEKPMVDSVSPAGYSRRQSGTELRVPWSDLKQVVETPDLFLFFHTPNCAYYLPKAVLSDAQRGTVRNLITASMPTQRVVVEPRVAA